jgi:hypothetical protein
VQQCDPSPRVTKPGTSEEKITWKPTWLRKFSVSQIYLLLQLKSASSGTWKTCLKRNCFVCKFGDVVDVGKECGGDHTGPCGIEKVIAAVSLRLNQGFQGATRWSISDTTAGLLKLYKRHASEGAEDTITGVQVTDR